MPVDNHQDKPDPAPAGAPPPTSAGPPRNRSRRRLISRRNAVISGIGLALALLALMLVSLIAYRLGFVDRYVAAQITDTLAQYGIRAEIKSFHTSLSPQT